MFLDTPHLTPSTSNWSFTLSRTPLMVFVFIFSLLIHSGLPKFRASDTLNILHFVPSTSTRTRREKWGYYSSLLCPVGPEEPNTSFFSPKNLPKPHRVFCFPSGLLRPSRQYLVSPKDQSPPPLSTQRGGQSSEDKSQAFNKPSPMFKVSSPTWSVRIKSKIRVGNLFPLFLSTPSGSSDVYYSFTTRTSI